MQTIDLRSDTVTQPTDEMRQAMYEAEVGDDVFGEDPTINQLEELAAHMTGKEAALFTTSGTMANLIAVLTHTHPGNEIIVGSEAHNFWHEVGGASALGGVVMHTVPNEENGQMNLDMVEQTIRQENIHFPETTLLCLENTHNRCGGAVITPEYTDAFTELAHKHGVNVHLDGARIFNAAVALNVPITDLTNTVDSVCFCVSKGLSAPVGSLLCGSQDFVARARKYRKMLGGGMRQAGVIAAAGIVAIQKMVSRLTEDHANAQRLAKGLASIPGIVIIPEAIQTNIVNFDAPDMITANKFIQKMGARGVKLTGGRGGQRVRAVTHRMISEADVDEAIERISSLLKDLT
ncbi:low-specificity L-threonine aldolase [Chloroflexota bacterium]